MNLESEKRVNTRTPRDEDIDLIIFTDELEKDSKTITAKVVDISATGIGIATQTTLKKGQKILFVKDQPNWQLPNSGIVVWSYTSQDGCRTGLEFVL